MIFDIKYGLLNVFKHALILVGRPVVANRNKFNHLDFQ